MDDTNLLEIFRRRLGVDTLAVLREESPLREKAYREVELAYGDWRAPVAPPPKDADEVRPVFAPSALAPTYEVAHSLLSLIGAHSVAIIVPNSINYIPRLAWLLTLLEEAIDAGLVHVLSEPTVGRSPEFFDQWMAENMAAPPAAPEEREAAALRLLETGDIALALDACANYPDHFDLACRTPAQREWLRQRIAALPTSATASHDKLSYLSDLLSLPLPVVSLGTNDVLALRRENVFDRWRVTLAQTVNEAMAMDDEEFLDPQSARIATLRERMDAAARDVAQEMKSLFGRVASETATFGIACASGAVGTVAAGATGAAAVGGTAYITTRVVEWLRDRQPGNAQHVRRVVANVFGPPH